MCDGKRAQRVRVAVAGLRMFDAQGHSRPHSTSVPAHLRAMRCPHCNVQLPRDLAAPVLPDRSRPVCWRCYNAARESTHSPVFASTAKRHTPARDVCLCLLVIAWMLVRAGFLKHRKNTEGSWACHGGPHASAARPRCPPGSCAVDSQETRTMEAHDRFTETSMAGQLT